MPAKSAAPVTVQDIARQTGLSPSSVSAVLSGQHVKRRIPQETVARVLDAARRLKYVPNVTARSLRAKGSGTKQVVLSVLTSYEAPVILVSQTLRALGRAIAEKPEDAVHYDVNVQMFHAGSLAELSGFIAGSRCNGAIVSNTVDRDDQFLASTQLPFPVVLLGRRIPGYPSVSVRSETMGRKAADILVAIGRRKLGVLQPTVLTQATRSRLAAFVIAAEQAVGLPPLMITCDSLEERDGYAGMQRFLASGAHCDGIFALSDGLAIGAYLAIKHAGCRIPEDFAMVGVGDNPASHYIDPPLTSFESAQDRQSEDAARLLLSLVGGTPPSQLAVEVPIAPLLRESTGHRSRVEKQKAPMPRAPRATS